jgi:hypothetical protein
VLHEVRRTLTWPLLGSGLWRAELPGAVRCELSTVVIIGGSPVLHEVRRTLTWPLLGSSLWRAELPGAVRCELGPTVTAGARRCRDVGRTMSRVLLRAASSAGPLGERPFGLYLSADQQNNSSRPYTRASRDQSL